MAVVSEGYAMKTNVALPYPEAVPRVAEALANEGFGILCMASIGPIVTVLITGLWARYKVRAQTRAATRTLSETHEQQAEAIL